MKIYLVVRNHYSRDTPRVEIINAYPTPEAASLAAKEVAKGLEQSLALLLSPHGSGEKLSIELTHRTSHRHIGRIFIESVELKISNLELLAKTAE